MTYFNRKLMKRDIPASATVEGALVIPVILYAVAAVMFLLQLISIRMHVNDALYNALRKFNTYSYTSQMLTGEIYKSTFFAIFVDEIGSDYAKKHYIAGGNTGWNFYGSDIVDDNSTVKISLKYTVKNPFNILGKRQITIHEKRITDIWLGEEKDGFELNNNDESEYVYITQYGEVYHIEKTCSYLVRNIKAASQAEITDLRNASGGKYYSCSLCKGASEIVYYTDYGDKYHSSDSCYALQRTILKVKKRKNQRDGMLQKMYAFIIQRGYMGSLIMLTGLAIMSFMDIKRRAVPVYMIIVMSILAIGIKAAEYIFGYKKVDIYEMFIILVVTTVFVVICVISHIMGAADALVMGIIAMVTGIKKATSVFFMALMFVSIISGILLIIKRLKRKDTIPFIPFIFISYVGVMICG